MDFSLVCLPPDVGGLIAIGGNNGDYIDVVESLSDERCMKWRHLAPLPIPLASRGGVYFKQRILLVGGLTTGGVKTSCMLAFDPRTASGPGQWVTIKLKLLQPECPRHITIFGNNLFLLSKLALRL